MNTTTRPRRRGFARWLMLALLVVPVVEVFIILKVGQQIGGLSTFLLLLFWSALGAWIVKREFSRAF
ncbi:FxsA family protein, partial [Dermacoccus nishinomiyaensis]